MPDLAEERRQQDYWWEAAWERGELSDDDIWIIIQEAASGFGKGLYDIFPPVFR